MRRLLLLFVLVLFTGLLVFSQATDPSKRYVAVKTTPLRSSVGFFAKDLTTLGQGDEVTLIRDDGKWAEVRSGSINGFVSSTSLSSRRVVASGTAVTASEVALAGKGLAEEMEIEYRNSGLNFSTVESMEKLNIPSDELLGFITEGHLARGE